MEGTDLKILICDDDYSDADCIRKALEISSGVLRMSFDVTVCLGGASAIKSGEKFDLAFIDIEMPGTDGLTVARRLKTLNPNVIVFIVTSYREYLDKAMDINVFRYFSKPIENSRFQESLKTAVKLYRRNTEKIVLEYFDECYSISTSDIIYLSIEKRKTKIVTTEREYLVRGKFAYWKKRMSAYEYFAQAQYSYIVNLRKVIAFDKTKATLKNGREKIVVPVSRAYYTPFKKAFYEYMGESL